MIRNMLLGLAICIMLSPALPAQNASGDAMIHAYLKKKTEEISQRFLDGAKTRAEWEAKLPKLREQYLDMLGLWPLPERTPLKTTITGEVKRDGVVIEKLHFQSKPGLYVTGNLYRPEKVEKPLPTILYVCGHSGKGRDGNKTAFQDHGMWFASNGYICLIVDTLQLGEVAGKHHGTYNLDRFWWHSLGYTPAGVECWNGMRAIDYLVSRKDVDKDRIGVTGISGGGASTVWIAAADERVKVAVPVSGMSDLESYVTNKVINGHCDCMFLVNTYGWEWTTIAALIAPRPMLFANSDKDSIFPMDGNRRIIKRLGEVYRMYDAESKVAEYVSIGGHDYRPDLRVAIFQFINKHLKGETGEVKDADFKPLPGKELRVFAEDKDIPADQVNDRIDQSFNARATVKQPEQNTFDAWKSNLLKQLREKSFRGTPERFPEASVSGEPVGVMWQLTAEAEVQYQAIEVVAAKPEYKHGTLLVLNPDEEILKVTRDWAKPFVDERIVYAILPRGGVPSAWTRGKAPNYVERAHTLLGTTVDAGRVRDIAAAARMFDAAKHGNISWRVVGRGQAGIIAAYAALFEPSIKEVVVVDPPASHMEGPHFLNVLRMLDIPETLGLLAPRPLTLINASDKTFDRTAQIYQAAGAEKKLTRK